MPLVPGTSLSFYEVLGPLGAGAMGEVYRARDTRLGREVAIKVLPEHFAEDEERLRRFEREARSLASLNHPNVAQIFGVDQVGDTCFLALELVPGETLEERIARGPLPLEEAVDTCRQIAEGLEAAHEAGVIHRDLKPANVRITPDGKVKLLDFGLAKATGPEAGVASTTDSVLATAEGRLLGTPTYMAPEQARGKPIDRRVDVWAFGCVLYECLTSQRAFDGETLGDVLAAVLEKEPDLTRVPARTPPHVRRLVERCLEKDPRMRVRDVGDAWLELQRDPEPELETKPRARSGPILFVAGVVAASIVVALYPRSAEPQEREIVRFALEGMGVTLDAFQGLALSPDGKRLVFRARDEQGDERLLVRSLDEIEARALPGTEFGWLPFFAPDSDRVGFFSLGELKTVTLSSGLVRSAARLPAGFSGGAWLADDTLLFTGTTSRLLWRVAATGGRPEEIPLDLPPEYDIVASPSALPDEGLFLLAVRRGSSSFEIALCTLDGEVTMLGENVFTPTWAASGHIVYQQGMSGPLMALPFDLDRREPTGDPFPVLTDLSSRVSYQVRTFTIAEDGTLAYFPAATVGQEGSLAWVDHEGNATAIEDFGKVIDTPRLSHDQSRIAFREPAPECRIWVHDLERGVTTLVTHESDNHGIAWTPDDDGIAFARPQDGLWDVVVSPPDGTGATESLSGNVIPRAFVADYSPDGRHVLVVSHDDATNADIDVVNVATGETTALVKTRFAEDQASFAPNGRWFAYVSDAAGVPEVFVQPFLEDGVRVQITTGGGAEPVWSQDGEHLYYRSGRRLMAVDVEIDGAFTAGRPRLVFEGEYTSRGASGLADYDLAADGTRFLMIQARLGRKGATVNVVLDCFTELRGPDPGSGE